MNDNQLSEHSGYHSGYQKWIDSLKKMFTALFRGGSRGRVQGVRTPPPIPEMTCDFLIQLIFCQKKKTMWFIGIEVEQETSAPLLKKILDPPLLLK